MYTIETTCPFCRKAHTVQVHGKDYLDWQHGVLAQDAFPYLSADEREMLISGICPTCWEKMFSSEEEEEEEEECFEPGRPIIDIIGSNP